MVCTRMAQLPHQIAKILSGGSKLEPGISLILVLKIVFLCTEVKLTHFPPVMSVPSFPVETRVNWCHIANFLQ